MRSLRPILFLLLSSMIFLGADCEEDNAPTEPAGQNSNVIMPLKLGTMWTYLDLSYDTSGVLIETDTTQFAVVGDTTINSEKWYYIGGIELLTNRSTGLWYAYPEEDGWSIAPGLMAKYPGQAGDTWSGPDSLVATLTNVGISIAVPHGNYTCYRYRYADPVSGATDAVRYFAVDKGLIQDEFYATTDSGREYVAHRRMLSGLVLTKELSSVDRQQGRFMVR
ncbi:MAG: hypothetical protein MUF82_00050 [Bacteroidetes bacterium]|nr:hypothetical protein [Bacteroidota bacterium]